MSSLLNKANTRRFIDSTLASTGRADRFTQVSKDFYERIEARLRAIIRAEIHSAPSVGQTLKQVPEEFDSLQETRFCNHQNSWNV